MTPRWQDLTPEDPGYENACLDYQVDLQSERARHPSVQRAVRTLRRRARGWLEMGPATDGFVLAAALTVLPAEDVSIASDLYIRLRQHMVDLPAHWSGTLAPILTALGELLELQHQTPGLPWRIGPLPAERPAA